MPLVKARRSPNVQTLRNVVEAVNRLTGQEPTFGDILGRLKSGGTLSNHRSLRKYLDLLVAARVLRLESRPAASPNVRPRQVYSLTGRGPYVKVGEGAMSFHGLNWETDPPALSDSEVDLEGVARATLESGTLYGSLEDTVVDALARAKGAEAEAVAATYSAALLATKRFDEGYLMRRARVRGVEEVAKELLDEIRSLLYSPKLPVEDIRALYALRRVRPALKSSGGEPRWSLFSPDGLLDVVGKQSGAS